MAFIETINPSTGRCIQQHLVQSDDEIDDLITLADQQWGCWQAVSIQSRCERVMALAAQLEQQEETLACLMTQEMGKTIGESRAEVQKCQRLCQYMVAHLPDMLLPKVEKTEFYRSEVHYLPLGVILAIMPWNYPLWQVLRFAIGTILAGNVVLLKHAPIVTGSAKAIKSLFAAAGFPEGVMTSLVINESQVPPIIADTRVKGVTLTGSGVAGRAVAAEAGRHLKKTMLELGGSDPYLILDDADIDVAATVCVNGRMANAGQVCIAPKRCIVVPSVYEAFKARVLEQVNQFCYGDPMRSDTRLGPLARHDLRDHLQQQVNECVAQGARVLCGGEIPSGVGFYYPPTVIDGVVPGMPAYNEELFGPVVSLIQAKDEADAIRIANDTCYGLGGGVFTQDLERGHAIATHGINVGTCYVNAAVASDPRFPIGGINASGYGRELTIEGVKEFLNIKVVCVKPSQG